MTPNIQSKMPEIGTSIFTVMSALATENNAINLGQGFPDFPMNADLVEEVYRVMKEGYNQYVPMQGYLPLRESLAQKMKELYGAEVDPQTEITITPGGTYAIFTSLTTLLQPADEVILFEPAYDSYIPNIRINGAQPVSIPLQYPGYRIDWERVRAAITSRTRVIMLNSPHNPTGTVLSEEDIRELTQIVENTDIFIVSDEVYEHLIFDQIPHRSMLRYPLLRERSLVNFSFGKTYHCTGWKLGYCVAPKEVMKEFRKIHQFNAFCCHTPSQVALSRFLRKKDSYLSLPGFMQAKRDFFLEQMKETPFEFLQSNGSYFICATYQNISDEPDIALAKRLTLEKGVATIPLSAFYEAGTDHKVLRFCFAKKEETIREAANRLRTLSN